PFKQHVKHALRSVVITRTDSGGEGPNLSRLLGFMAAEGLANTYLPEDERTVGSSFERTGRHIAIRAATNVMKEYWPNIIKRATTPGTQPQDQEIYRLNLATVRARIDQAYQDKLDGKIPEDFWRRKMEEWNADERGRGKHLSGLPKAS